MYQKKEMIFLAVCAIGITVSLGMYFFQSSQSKDMQANIFVSSEKPVRESVALSDILPGVYESQKEHAAAPNIVLTASVDKNMASAGDKLLYTITVHNRGKQPYHNIQVRALFPFDFLNFVKAKHLAAIDSQNQFLLFKKSTLDAGEIWIIPIYTTIKSDVTGNMKIVNAVTVSADNINVSELYDYSETRIVPKQQPEELVSSGGKTLSLIFLFLGLLSLFHAYKKRREVVCVFLEKEGKA